MEIYSQRLNSPTTLPAMIYQTKRFNPGEYVVREGELGNGFYILDAGDLDGALSDQKERSDFRFSCVPA